MLNKHSKTANGNRGKGQDRHERNGPHGNGGADNGCALGETLAGCARAGKQKRETLEGMGVREYLQP